MESDGENVTSIKKIKKNKKPKLKIKKDKTEKKKGLSKKKKKKDEKTKLDELYKLEIKNYKNGKKLKGKKYNDDDNNISDDSDLLNNDYDDIKEISKQVNEQIKLYKHLLRIRILTQKVLTLSNKLPLLSFVTFNNNITHNDHIQNNHNNSILSLLNNIQENEEEVKEQITKVLIILHTFLKKYFLKRNIPINENKINDIDIICDEDDKEFFQNRRNIYIQHSTHSEQKLFSLIDTWFTYSKNMCLNFFDIIHKITKLSSIKTIKTYEQPISSQINQVMFELPSIIEKSYPQNISYDIIGKDLYDYLNNDKEFNLNKYIYDDEAYYKKFLLNAIQNLKDNQEDSELLKSQRQIYKIKKKYNKKENKGKVLSNEPIPKLVNFMLPEPRDNKIDNNYEYMDNPDFINVLLSSLFQE
ncbi:conserved Plasmodium protein, unknown function [Plasmodium sp. gorilla clade G2]|uniref:conserved Plasmodium protein, unknown function n=1 Tax=Plasmodium sp. gorilla clade G2 TaxID=880535 RepID=UPI000D219897|nr:conserved Plasmodium protein, unknown function [Plasmodium sp. gorilla clade G2]SOV16458.1 conserved Plasmodium protein, unknown function [Plasmodium sp. gorilla clade G2]